MSMVVEVYKIKVYVPLGTRGWVLRPAARGPRPRSLPIAVRIIRLYYDLYIYLPILEIKDGDVA